MQFKLHFQAPVDDPLRLRDKHCQQEQRAFRACFLEFVMRIPVIIASLAAFVAAAPAVWAADLGTGRSWNQEPAYTPPPAINWTGAYLGLNAGAGWGHAGPADTSGFVLGAHGGYNFQFDRFVVGG